MIRDLVSHNLHDVVAIGDETHRDGSRENGELPDRDRSILGRSLTVHPGMVDNLQFVSMWR